MKKTLAIMLALIMVLALVPTVAFAEEPKKIYVDANKGDDANDGSKDKPYKTVGKAAEKAATGSTIYLADGNYSTYTPKDQPNYGNKNLTFIGNNKDKVIWQIGAKTPDPALLGTEYNGDYSFDSRSPGEHDYTIKFQNLTLMSADKDYLGFIGADNTVVENCTMFGRTAYWGYTSATFKDTTFNCPNGSYALWTYSSPTMTFESCTFNSTGKVINVYNEGDTPNVTVNFNNCTVNSENIESLSVMNINDALVQSFTINFNGKNTIKGIKADGIHETGGSHASAASSTDSTVKKTSAQATCSKLFEFNIKHGSPTNKTTVTIDGKTVWQDGKMVGHAIGTQYTDGYKDKAFTVEPNGPGSFEVKCDYCGYTEISTGELSNDIKLERTVKQNSNLVSADAANPNKYKVANNSNITVDYTATMNMENLRWQVAGKDVEEIQKKLGEPEVKSPWELLKYLALAKQIDGRTEVILTFKFDDKIDLEAFKDNYNKATPEDKKKLLMLESDMFKMTDVAFGTDNTMTIKCNWNKETDPNPDPTITLKGNGLPVKNDWNGSKQIDITNSGCVGGMVHINPMGGAMEAMVEPGSNVAANVQVQNTTPPEIPTTIQIPIVGGCKTDEFTLYYGGGSSGDSGHSYYYPTTTPVPVIVIPPKTGDMTVWQSILHFLGIR